tara:strand:+ start:171 stop:374 length:204 start_codon:yes stop_codon:yes gene_type:complete
MKNCKVIFRGNKVPSGMTLDVECFITEKKLQNLEKDGRFDIEVIEKSKATKPKPKKKKAPKKETSDE